MLKKKQKLSLPNLTLGEPSRLSGSQLGKRLPTSGQQARPVVRVALLCHLKNKQTNKQRQLKRWPSYAICRRRKETKKTNKQCQESSRTCLRFYVGDEMTINARGRVDPALQICSSHPSLKETASRPTSYLFYKNYNYTQHKKSKQALTEDHLLKVIFQ